MKNLEMMKQIMRESGIKSKESMLAETNQEIELRQKDIEDGQWYFFDNMLLDEIIDIKIQLMDDMKRVEGNDLFFAKVRPTAKIPTKDNENMGYDIYADFEENFILIQPHETKMIPTGICSACSEDYAIVLKERGSTGTKGIAQRCGVIDSGYRNEWFVPVTNTTDYPLIISKLTDSADILLKKLYGDISPNKITIYPYEKAICQAVVLPVPKMNVKEISLEELKAIPSKRGEGCLGSSGK
jgi:dUTP pyrophosphatase